MQNSFFSSNFSNSEVNVLIAVDSHYFFQPLTTLVSLRKSLPANVRLNCYLMHYEDESRANFSLIGKHLFPTDSIIDLPLPHHFRNFDFGRWNDNVMQRLIAIYYLPSSLNRILYLDGDIVIDGDILAMYTDAHIDNHTLCATKESLPWTKMSSVYTHLDGKCYFNSGALVINVPLWKRNFPDLLSFKNAVIALPFRPQAIDQDILNYLFRDSKYIMPDDRYMRFCDGYHYVWIEEAYRAKRPVVLHFAGPHKPWNVIGNPKYRKIYWKYGKHVYPLDFQRKLRRQRFAYVVGFPLRKIRRFFARDNA